MTARRVKPAFVRLSEADWNKLTEEQQNATIINFQFGLSGTKAIPTPAAAAPAPEKTEDKKEALPELEGIRNWTESVDGVSAERLRNCIIYMLDVKKDEWYTSNMSRGFVKRMAKRLDDDTPEDFVYDPDPLFGTYTYHGEEGDQQLTKIRRQPKNEAERKKIREKFGVNTKTIPFLAKKNCPTCKGKGFYSVSSYPNDPVYSRLEEFVDCTCSYE